MQKTKNKLFHPSFWLSILLHLLILIGMFALIMTPLEKMEKKKEPQRLPHHYVPAYTYTGSIKPAALSKSSSKSNNSPTHNNIQSQNKNIKKATENTESEPEQQQINHPQGILQVQKIPKKKNIIHKPQQQSMLAASFNMLKDKQLKEVSKTREAEPIYLIGDDSHPADPLIKLMGRSLSAHFGYPRTAGELGIRGKVIIELTLHPEGYFSDVQMLRSSSNQDLDAAALYAVNSAPKVVGANRYISKPRHFVIGFVFY
jgi:TonB family protein